MRREKRFWLRIFKWQFQNWVKLAGKKSPESGYSLYSLSCLLLKSHYLLEYPDTHFLRLLSPHPSHKIFSISIAMYKEIMATIASWKYFLYKWVKILMSLHNLEAAITESCKTLSWNFAYIKKIHMKFIGSDLTLIAGKKNLVNLRKALIPPWYSFFL